MSLLREIQDVLFSYDFKKTYNTTDKSLQMHSSYSHFNERSYIEIYKNGDNFYSLHLYGFEKSVSPHIIEISSSSIILDLEQYLESNL